MSTETSDSSRQITGSDKAGCLPLPAFHVNYQKRGKVTGGDKLATNPQTTSGHTVRQLRDSLDVSRNQFAKSLGLSQSQLTKIECHDRILPPEAATAFRAIETLTRDKPISQLPKKRSWQHSATFKERPPFLDLPGNGVACRCADSACSLGPVRDEDSPAFGHPWQFRGRRCNTRVFLDSDGKIVCVPVKTWRDSTTFEQKPPFDLLPKNGSACGCGNAKCRLGPKGDADWPLVGHLWCFWGRTCNVTVYLNAEGKRVNSPARQITRGKAGEEGVAREVCTGCGGTRCFRAYASKRLNLVVWIRRCTPKSRTPHVEHDPPTYWWDKDGKFEMLPAAAVDQLHGPHRRQFSVPRCERPVCPRYGQKMAKAYVVCLTVKDAGNRDVALYRCRGHLQSHIEYRVLPNGELATRIGLGRYCWMDSVTGSTIETVRGKRLRQVSREMPASKCPDCAGTLRQVVGPWSVQRKKHRRWRAECKTCLRIFRVRDDGEIRERKDSKHNSKRGRGAGVTVGDTDYRITVAADLKLQGLTALYQIAEHLFPQQHQKEQRRDAAKKFLKRHADKITNEHSRLTTLSEADRIIVVALAKQQLLSPRGQ